MIHGAIKRVPIEIIVILRKCRMKATIWSRPVPCHRVRMTEADAFARNPSMSLNISLTKNQRLWAQLLDDVATGWGAISGQEISFRLGYRRRGRARRYQAACLKETLRTFSEYDYTEQR
jgi:hypothetical protein